MSDIYGGFYNPTLENKLMKRKCRDDSEPTVEDRFREARAYSRKLAREARVVHNVHNRLFVKLSPELDSKMQVEHDVAVNDVVVAINNVLAEVSDPRQIVSILGIH